MNPFLFGRGGPGLLRFLFGSRHKRWDQPPNKRVCQSFLFFLHPTHCLSLSPSAQHYLELAQQRPCSSGSQLAQLRSCSVQLWFYTICCGSAPAVRKIALPPDLASDPLPVGGHVVRPPDLPPPGNNPRHGRLVLAPPSPSHMYVCTYVLLVPLRPSPSPHFFC